MSKFDGLSQWYFFYLEVWMKCINNHNGKQIIYWEDFKKVFENQIIEFKKIAKRDK